MHTYINNTNYLSRKQTAAAARSWGCRAALACLMYIFNEKGFKKRKVDIVLDSICQCSFP